MKLSTPLSEQRRTLLRQVFDAAVAAVSAEHVLPQYLPADHAGRIYVAAFGKAAAAMALVAEATLPVTGGIAVTRYNHGLLPGEILRKIELVEASHPMPDDAGLHAADRMLSMAGQLKPDDLLLALVSGGGSALLNKPLPPITLDDKRDLTRQLLHSGAVISEINCVRKHLSAIKGGRLALAANGADILTLAISDIPGDDISMIASGPTIADTSTQKTARDILYKHDITPPPSVTKVLTDTSLETPDAGHPAFRTARSAVVAKASDALRAAASTLGEAGYTVINLGDALEGDAEKLARTHAAKARESVGQGKPVALLSGGETTVEVRNPEGRGGRNTTYLLALADALGKGHTIHAIACDSDGIDGTENNAGAIIDPTTLDRAAAVSESFVSNCLENNDSYTFFKTLGDLVVTGPTRTNVNDFRLILVE